MKSLTGSVCGLLLLPALGCAQSSWTVARSAHFEVYSQAGPQAASSALAWFEQLREFFVQQTGLSADGHAPIRVIGFRSADQYREYRLRPTADAYYVGDASRDYIVLPSLTPGQFGMSAHEYVHLLIHDSGLKLPAWLGEGLAEVFSTVDIGKRLPAANLDVHDAFRLLRHRDWMPLAELLALTHESFDANRDRASIFYLESCALVHMLLLSPDYTPRVTALLTAIASGVPSDYALTATYNEKLEAIRDDLRAWTGRSAYPAVAFARVPPVASTAETSELSSFESRLLLADLLLACGELDRAERLYRELAREDPSDADAAAALGSIALRRKDLEVARREWKRAIELGVNDAALCFEYAVLAENASLKPDEIRPALERAVTLRPDFDNARYVLGLLEKNTGHFEAALAQFHAMRAISPGRAFQYWVAVSSSNEELGRHEEAKAAAIEAARHALTAGERAYASELAYISETDVAVRFTRDARGNPVLATTRKPRNSDTFNPFIEPGDQIRRLDGSLRDIDCGPPTKFVVIGPQGPVTVTMADPTRVQIRNGPGEFTCGAQPLQPVTIEYNSTGVLRGLEFR
ncbi:MAG TPA: tetratricopeptide repeat protein [Bryobacteraceae bacterium]|nr:tetratricopeptide repeat protein [Bryobacteraceae bacterium]